MTDVVSHPREGGDPEYLHVVSHPLRVWSRLFACTLYVYYDTHRRCITMRTNIVLNDELVKEAFQYAKVSTKKELVDLALREFVQNHKRRDVRELVGKVKIKSDYDYKSLRTAKILKNKEK